MPRGLDGVPAIVTLLVGVVGQSFTVMVANTASAQYAARHAARARTPCSPFCPDLNCSVDAASDVTTAVGTSAAGPHDSAMRQSTAAGTQESLKYSVFAADPHGAAKRHLTLTPLRLDLIFFTVLMVATTIFHVALWLDHDWF